MKFSDHKTVFESRKERQSQGRSVDPVQKGNLVGGMGGVSDFVSLADGADIQVIKYYIIGNDASITSRRSSQGNKGK